LERAAAAQPRTVGFCATLFRVYIDLHGHKLRPRSAVLKIAHEAAIGNVVVRETVQRAGQGGKGVLIFVRSQAFDGLKEHR
jgi:hypothetical protein